METNGGTTVEKIGKGIGIAAEAAVVGVIGTVAAFGTAVTDVIIPATAQAAQETKALFPDPLNPGTDSEPYVKCLGIAAKNRCRRVCRGGGCRGEGDDRRAHSRHRQRHEGNQKAV